MTSKSRRDTRPPRSAAWSVRGGLLGALILLSGCQTTATTDVSLTSQTTATISATVDFSGAVAARLHATPALQAQLVHTITTRAGVVPVLETNTAQTMLYTVPLTYAKLTAASSVLGIQQARLTALPNGQVRFQAALVTPTALQQAVTSGTSAQPDAPSLQAAMLATTYVSLSVHAAGGIVSTAGPVAWKTASTTTTETQSLAAFTPGPISVVAQPVAHSPLALVVEIGGAALVIWALVAAWLRRRPPTATRYWYNGRASSRRLFQRSVRRERIAL